jgi:hypothetical protein
MVLGSNHEGCPELKVAIYAPAYSKSPGTRYKVDMLRKAIMRKHEAILICDEDESILRHAYRHLGPSLLNWHSTWERIGKRIGNTVLSADPDAAVLITDISASAIPFLKKNGVKTILSVEDLTPVWLKMSNPDPFYAQLRSFSRDADGIITVSEDLREKLQRIGIPSEVAAHGIEKLYVNEEEASGRRARGIVILNSGQVEFEEERKAFEISASKILEKYPLMSYSFGRHNPRLQAKFPQITWYNYSSPEEALPHLKECSIGLMIRFNTERPTRLFYHASMLQPIVAIGDRWVSEVSQKKIGIAASPEGSLETVDTILADYANYIKSIRNFAQENLLENAYAPLMRMLG